MFGINAASEIFQNAIAELLAGLPGCKNISDDIIAYEKDQLEHDLNLQAVLQRLSDYNGYASPLYLTSKVVTRRRNAKSSSRHLEDPETCNTAHGSMKIPPRAYRAGKDNPADFMSRHPKPVNFTNESENLAELYANDVCSNAIPKAMTREEVKT
ncbi:Hypothetical predicted protein [Paramuricea clavata]|uniref:Uncharacterized protein n=1 Tax=Paramuricea clavata TaxID=317549 RepID=A0A7D9DJL6_PARCT|nr:Hypothetical predicted protein [Paramuricea clavata]